MMRCVSILYTLLSLGLMGCGGGAQSTSEPAVTAGQAGAESGGSAAGAAANAGSAGSAGAQPQEPQEPVTRRELAYPAPHEGDTSLNTLDLFDPGGVAPRPLVLLVHGGSWVGGDKAGYERDIVPWWLERGYIAAPVNFRLATGIPQGDGVKPRDQARDIASALGWLLSRAEEYHIDPSRVILVGYSSGAHLVALLGTDERLLEEVNVEPESVLASISLDVHAYDVPYALSLMEGSVVEQNIPLIHHLFGEEEAEQLESSPISFVDGWAARSLIISVDAAVDEVGSHGYIVSQCAQRYVEALRAAGHQSETLHDASETHSSLVMGYGQAGDLTTQAIQELIDELP